MRDFNVLSYVGRSLWSIHPDKWAEMMPALIRHAKGDKLSDDQLLAFMGGDEKEEPRSSRAGTVAIVPIRGVIAHRMDAMRASSGGTSCESIQAMLRQAFASDAGTILLDVDSPGGTVAGCQELAAWLYEARGRSDKKVVALANGQMCSAGYWIPAAAADEIIATPSADIGSIGVFAVHKDLSEALAKEGIKITLIKAGKFKTEGNPFEPLSEEAQAVMQARVDEAYGQFIKDVARGRNVAPSAVKSGYGEGRSLPAKEAKRAGLIDRIATMDETLARLTGAKSSRAGMRAEDETPPVMADCSACGFSHPEGQTECDAVIAKAEADPFDAMRERLERF